MYSPTGIHCTPLLTEQVLFVVRLLLRHFPFRQLLVKQLDLQKVFAETKTAIVKLNVSYKY